MRDTISLNGTWDFMPLYQQHVSGLPEEICYAPEPVQVPSSWRQSSQEFRIEKYGFDPFHMFEYPAIWDEAESGVLHRVVTLEKDQIGQRLVLQFNGIFSESLYLLERRDACRNARGVSAYICGHHRKGTGGRKPITRSLYQF